MDAGNITPPSSSSNKGITEDRDGFVSGIDDNIPGWSVEALGGPAWSDLYSTMEFNKIIQAFRP